MTNGAVQVATEVGRVAEEPRWPVMRSRLAILVTGGSVTTHCPAATALCRSANISVIIVASS
jgi:hypothetical protein